MHRYTTRELPIFEYVTMLKAINILFNDGHDKELSPIFESSNLNKACSGGNTGLVEQLFNNSFSGSTELVFQKHIGIVNKKTLSK